MNILCESNIRDHKRISTAIGNPMPQLTHKIALVPTKEQAIYFAKAAGQKQNSGQNHFCSLF
jgi:hypothetical protein